jgi:hypothetical protein
MTAYEAEQGITAPPSEIKPMKPRSWAFGRGERKRKPSDDPRTFVERVRPSGMVWLSWRWVSGTLMAALLVVLAIMLGTDAFYVDTVAVGGVNYLTREEVFRFSGVSQKHIFWVDPEEVKARLEANNNIAEAEVQVGWSPALVQIVIRERVPVLTWEQNNDRVWVDINGIVMFQREDRPDLLRIVYDPSLVQTDQVFDNTSRIDPEIVHGALLLKSRLTSIDVLLYHPIKGLGWRDPRGWMAWFGIGDNMAMKAQVYEALVNYNIDALQFGEVDVSDPDSPVYTVLWRKDQ